jgi:hypothetical protein
VRPSKKASPKPPHSRKPKESKKKPSRQRRYSEEEEEQQPKRHTKSLQEECRDRLVASRSEEFDRKLKQKQDEMRSQENDMLRLIYGPNWKDC